jgi:amino acid transporter
VSLTDVVFGRPLASSEESKESLTVLTGVPVLGLDAIASTGYGPEAALLILGQAGLVGLHYYRYIVIAIVAMLTSLYLSYQQTAAAYPSGGGAYNVAKDNLGARPAVWAAVALLIDYLLNVAVGISAGIGAVVSAIPSLQSHILLLCLSVLVILTVVNLRGVRESGLAFVTPALCFVVCVGAAIAIGLVRVIGGGGHVTPAVPLPPLPPATHQLSAWLLLGAFASGCTAVTGIEAVSNGVPLFRPPKVRNARITLTIIFLILALFLLALGYLLPAYHIHAMNEQQQGYQTVLSQLIAAVTGKGVFYYITNVSIFIVLTYSAQTSFADFPRVCRLLAEDDLLPHSFATRGRRLVFSTGILVLALMAGVLLVVFQGLTDKLIPLFAVGAFSAFVLSQVGMVHHWLKRKKDVLNWAKLASNALGAVATIAALAVMIAAKFTEGAWIVIVVVPGLVFLLRKIQRHYEQFAKEEDSPLKLQTGELRAPIVIVPINAWNRIAGNALQFATSISDEVICLHVETEENSQVRLRQRWAEMVEKPAKKAGMAVPRLEVVDSPYRWIHKPLIDFIEKTAKRNEHRLIAVVIPELVEPNWYEFLLHNWNQAKLRAHLFLRPRARTIVINTPWDLHGGTGTKVDTRRGGELKSVRDGSTPAARR